MLSLSVTYDPPTATRAGHSFDGKYVDHAGYCVEKDHDTPNIMREDSYGPGYKLIVLN